MLACCEPLPFCDLFNAHICDSSSYCRMTDPRRNFVQFHAQGFCVFKKFATETDVAVLLEAVTAHSFEPEWVEIHNWGATTDKATEAKRWMAAAPECAQKLFEEKVVPFLESGGLYSTKHDINLGRGVAVLR
jgi:hypothetical protein